MTSPGLAYWMANAPNQFVVNEDESVDFCGNVHWPAGTNLASGVGVCIFGPGGGQANFGVIADGAPGLPPVIQFVTEQVAYGTALPSVNPATVLVSPGGPGVASVYNVTSYVNAGAPGATGPNSVLAATDVAGTPATGQGLIYRPTGGSGGVPAAVWETPKVGGWYSLSGISGTASTTSANRLLDSITIPAQAWPSVFEVFARCLVVGAVDTRVDLVARLGDQASGDQLCYCEGQTGTTPPTLVANPDFGVSMPGSSTAGYYSIGHAVVPAGTSGIVYLRAENQTASSNPWSTGAASLSVKVTPVP
jgi:hypothetical protein